MNEFPPYPSGLRLAGRKVVVVGGGHVAQRRVPALIAAGARVTLVAPTVTPALEGMGGEIEILARRFEPGDLDGAWYVIAATNDPVANELVTQAAEERRIFCVRSDDAAEATAWTPATGRHGSVTVAVLGNREPQQSAALRDEILTALRDGHLNASGALDRTPGVVLVGGGPGDPELVTVAARHALASADVVVADRLAPRELLDELGPDVELVDVAKLPRGRSAQQEFINQLIVDRAREGKRVVRFKGGDNFVFGRGFEEIEACRAADVPVTVIPGLSSSISVPAVAQIPVTHRGVAHEFTVVSGHIPPGHPDSLVTWDALARLQGTIVVLMGVENAAAIASALVQGGRDTETPVAVVVEGTMPEERTVLSTLGSLADDLKAQDVKPPAVIVIGEVVRVARPEHYGHSAPSRG
ncbi:uroporphyrinogen-III C-methyltransferase [Nocardioides gansuensis]|uniref:Uroporphyrinogen-III C-methyltransferase n=1 Tax=Nocardioides gansuensis TaxID=2138300 RepID=A0A2T8FED0_9ACTN|nr:uroporphyrinogen-III C-methyltransferase [Nocardioides gansuensis]PVG84050.1 uroporphyrinogen-III C-methyltransferase [Nocardioides gansuensis]